MVKTKRYFKASILMIIGLIFLINPLTLKAVDKNVYDDANLFSVNEMIELSDHTKKLKNEYEMDIVIVTTVDALNKSSQDFAEQFYKENYLSKSKEDSAILFLIDLDNQEVYIATYNKAIEYLSDSRQKSILDSVFANGLDDKDYFQASKTFLLKTEDYLKKGIPQINEKDEIISEKNSLTFVEAGVSLIIGAIISFIFYKKTQKSYKVKNPIVANNLKANTKTNFTVSQDILINSKTESEVLKNHQKDDVDTKSSTHTSKSGETFGGSGRKI